MLCHRHLTLSCNDKVDLPVDVCTNSCFLQRYCQAILSLQKEAGSETAIPLAIMTSGDTHDRTLALLEENNYFGMAAGQVSLVKQELVPALLDNDAHIAQDEEVNTVYIPVCSFA